MSTIVIIVLVVAALLGLALLFPRIAKSYASNSAMERCAALRAQLDGLGAGADPVHRETLLAQLRTCNEEAQAAGAQIDLGEVTLRGCTSLEAGIENEFSSYRTVQYHDPAQRENKRGSIIRGEDQLVRCYRTVLDDATSVETLNKLRNAVVRSLENSLVREKCWGDRAGGCDRSGDSSEPEGMSKVRDEWSHFRDPLRALIPAIDEKRATLAAAAAATQSRTQPPVMPFLLPTVTA